MPDDPIRVALRRIKFQLEALQIHYAVVGYTSSAMDIAIVVRPHGLRQIHAALDRLGYVSPFTRSKSSRDVETGVRVEFLVTGQYPGDGKPKPVVFPYPAQVAIEIEGIRYVALPTLIDLKLASGMTNPGRLRDLADVQELIRILNLPLDYREQLNPYVRDKYAEL